MASTVGARITGEVLPFSTAEAVSSASDVNGDGIDDLLVGDQWPTRKRRLGRGVAGLRPGGRVRRQIDLGSLGALGVRG